MAEQLTELHLVDNLSQALAVAHELGALGIGVDVEGVLCPYIGNNPTASDYNKFSLGYLGPLTRDIQKHPETAYGLMTNNTNLHDDKHKFGVPSEVARQLSWTLKDRILPVVHKGMRRPDTAFKVSAKPSGEQGLLLASMLDIDPLDMVLIDDQGVKNTGEAVKAGFKAMIVLHPIGIQTKSGRSVEHPGVMFGRRFEPAIYRSLKRADPGILARLVYEKSAGIFVSQIGEIVDHRSRTTS